MRGGFSFLEVLVSIAILSFLGTALIKFNSFNKRAMERNILSQRNILLSSPLIFKRVIKKKKKVTLFTLTHFTNLTDADRKFLKSIVLVADKEVEDKIFLDDTGSEKLYLEYGNLYVKYKENTQTYLWMQKSK